jgi:hypothetical protein
MVKKLADLFQTCPFCGQEFLGEEALRLHVPRHVGGS